MPSEILKEELFTDANKGEKASAEKLEKIYGTSDPIEVAIEMFAKGTFQ